MLEKTKRLIYSAVQKMMSGGSPVVPDKIFAKQLNFADLLEEFIDTGALLSTSGTTGKRKGVLLSRQAMRASAEATIKYLGNDKFNWHCVLPIEYVAGFMILVRAVLSDTEPVFSSPDLSDLTIRPGKNVISLVSTQLYRAMGNKEILGKLRKFDHILIGGSAIDQQLLAEGKKMGLPLVTTYGMSETCGGCVYDGQPLSEVELQIKPLGVAKEGQIFIKAPQLFSGYFPRDLANKNLIDGWLATQDRGYISDGRLVVSGRIDEVIISGGMNIDLAKLQCAITQINNKTVVTGVADIKWGTKVVLISELDWSLAKWCEKLANKFPKQWLPKQVCKVDHLPVSARGKINRDALLKLVYSDKEENGNR